jgi:hypothetical protein
MPFPQGRQAVTYKSQKGKHPHHSKYPRPREILQINPKPTITKDGKAILPKPPYDGK